MTSSNPSDQQFNKLEDDDLFLVNKDLNGDGSKYETFAVAYKNMLGPVTGDTGSTGPQGATGIQGIQGDPGTSIELKGIVDYYEDLFPIRAGFTGEEEGVVYIVRNDYSAKPSGSYSGSLPGTPECSNPSAPSDTTCERNVAYVFSYSATSYFGQNIADVGPGNFVFIRIGPLTGPVGATGYASENYDTVRVVEDSDTMYSIAFEDKGYKDAAGNRIDTDKYYDADLGDYFADGLAPTSPIGDIRGATGPFFDEITRHGKFIKKSNPDFDDSKPDTWNGTEDELPYTEATYDDVLDQAKFAELAEGSTEDYNPSFRYYNYVDIEFTSSNTPNPDVASDPHDVLYPFLIKDLVGATGANTGSQGPRGEEGAEGATGPYYANVSGDFRNDGEDNVTSNNPGERNYSLTFTTTPESDPDGKLISPLHLKQDLLGPAVDSQQIFDIINNIEIEYPEPPTGATGPVELDGPFVHRGSKCGSGDNVNENIYGRKTFRDRLAFNPCDTGEARMIDFPANISLYSRKNVNNGRATMDFLKIFSRAGGGGNNVVSVGIRQGADAAVGVKVERPQYALEAKGSCLAGTFTSVVNTYFDSAKPLSGYTRTEYGKRGMDYYFYGAEPNEYSFGLNMPGGKFTFRRNLATEGGKFTINFGKEGGFKIMPSSMTTAGAPNEHLAYNSSNGVVSRRAGSRLNAFVVGASDEVQIGDLVSADTALTVVKALKPRRITTAMDGATHIGFDKDEIPAATRANIEVEQDGEQQEASLNSLVGLLVLSIQKLEERISALES